MGAPSEKGRENFASNVKLLSFAFVIKVIIAAVCALMNKNVI